MNIITPKVTMFVWKGSIFLSPTLIATKRLFDRTSVNKVLVRRPVNYYQLFSFLCYAKCVTSDLLSFVLFFAFVQKYLINYSNSLVSYLM